MTRTICTGWSFSHCLWPKEQVLGRIEQDLEQFTNVRGPLYEACKWIVCKKVDHDRYSLLNENDVAALLLMYWSLPDRKPYLDFYDKEFVKSAIDDDIQEAIRKAKLFPRLTVDQYTCLLIEMVRAKVRNGWIFCSPKLRRQLI
ncbi:uncharacterized protein LOC104894134 isoform X4 [Beta vulgaris subsp. vulgaris]|uniref:uncharacterized protein LOC104894134 isoform X4 n=1 Tax=Beta vulgaris subsp. vulgaris TaxID=3555 RepID=UPI002549044B|nr:uncharacterized protein LOC104894134 isoform X4 [Beta vulgaris subsp. vulgaris]